MNSFQLLQRLGVLVLVIGAGCGAPAAPSQAIHIDPTKDSDIHLLVQKIKVDDNAWFTKLLDQDPALVNRSIDGTTILRLAIWQDKVDLVNLLLERGADVHDKDNLGRTVIYYLAQERNDGHLKEREACLDLLLGRGAILNQSLGIGTPLGAAFGSKSYLLAKYMISCGANPWLKLGGGWTPIHDCVMSGSLEWTKAYIGPVSERQLRERGVHQFLGSACASGNYDLVVYLVNRGEDVNCVTLQPAPNPATIPLTLAVYMGSAKIATFLLDHGANPNWADNKGDTALHTAAMAQSLGDGNWVGIIKLLLAHGANLNLQDKAGKTAYDYAIDGERSTNDGAVVVEYVAGAKLLAPRGTTEHETRPSKPGQF
ncbi:MAG: ankyrin repeat domain-containing protein [Terriglobia bacterium]